MTLSQEEMNVLSAALNVLHKYWKTDAWTLNVSKPTMNPETFQVSRLLSVNNDQICRIEMQVKSE